MVAIVTVAVVVALGYAAVNYSAVSRLAPGTDLMVELAGAIREGADAFIRHEYRVIFSVAALIAVLLGVVVAWYTGVSFLLGATMSATAGWIGMRIATLANVRVSNRARESRDIGKTLKVALQGGSVMGLSVAGFSLLGLLAVYLVFGRILGQADPSSLQVERNWLGVSFIPFTMSVSGYALGCSVIAMFDRVGGGIYTKAADMGADLVGKTEAHIPEDDPRNPATIADNVGDNVGDVAGLGADLLESFVGAIISCAVLAAYVFASGTIVSNQSAELVTRLLWFPLIFCAAGVLSSVIGLLFVLLKPAGTKPHRDLNIATLTAAALTLGATAALSWWSFASIDLRGMGFRVGWASPWLAAVLGILSGVTIGQLAERSTSFDFGPTRSIAAASRQGYALNITQGLAIGMKSVFAPMIVLAAAVIGANALAGLYGVGMAAVGMLSFVAATVSVDTYGPIADNAGGISEMSKLDPQVREITDELDAVGNTTAAIGKGFAIGSAALAALSLFASYLFSQSEPGAGTAELVLNMVDTLTLAGALVGAALPFLFSGILIEAVAKAARKMVDEVRRQFREDPKILTGEHRPDYRLCIEISSAGSLQEMRTPALIAVLTPIVGGFLLGASFVGGLLIGTTLSAIMLALFTANSGGAWDNAKKYIEQGKHGGKGSEAHDAGVVGDTVGDPLKDTVGPSLDILIKIMAVVSLIAVSVFQRYNLLSLFSG